MPLAAVLPSCDAVVSHGGSGTVLATLAHGLPTVILPLGADQPLHADALRRAGSRDGARRVRRRRPRSPRRCSTSYASRRIARRRAVCATRSPRCRRRRTCCRCSWRWSGARRAGRGRRPAGSRDRPAARSGSSAGRRRRPCSARSTPRSFWNSGATSAPSRQTQGAPAMVVRRLAVVALRDAGRVGPALRRHGRAAGHAPGRTVRCAGTHGRGGDARSSPSQRGFRRTAASASSMPATRAPWAYMTDGPPRDRRGCSIARCTSASRRSRPCAVATHVR